MAPADVPGDSPPPPRQVSSTSSPSHLRLASVYYQKFIYQNPDTGSVWLPLMK